MSSSPRSPLARNSVAWALLSQSLWLPLLAIDLHDRWQANVNEQAEIAAAAARGPANPPASAMASVPGRPTTAGPGQGAGATRSGMLLGSANPASTPGGGSHSGVLLETDSAAPAQPPARGGRQPGQVSASRITAPSSGLTLSWGSTFSAGSRKGQNSMLGGYSRAELLGGSLGLSDLRGGSMPPLAMAERARWAVSGDPLAPLPGAWREPMRKALLEIPAGNRAKPAISGARVIHVPSTRVRQSTAVPLALQPDGSVDILTQPDNPAVVDEIRQWSARQTPSASGGVTAAVVHLEPLPEAARPITPPASIRRAPSQAAATGVAAPHAAVQARDISARVAAPLAPAEPAVAAPAPAPMTSAPAPAPLAAAAAPVAAATAPVAAPAVAPEPRPEPAAPAPPPLAQP